MMGDWSQPAVRPGTLPWWNDPPAHQQLQAGGDNTKCSINIVTFTTELKVDSVMFNKQIHFRLQRLFSLSPSWVCQLAYVGLQTQSRIPHSPCYLLACLRMLKFTLDTKHDVRQLDCARHPESKTAIHSRASTYGKKVFFTSAITGPTGYVVVSLPITPLKLMWCIWPIKTILKSVAHRRIRT